MTKTVQCWVIGCEELVRDVVDPDSPVVLPGGKVVDQSVRSGQVYRRERVRCLHFGLCYWNLLYLAWSLSSSEVTKTVWR